MNADYLNCLAIFQCVDLRSALVARFDPWTQSLSWSSSPSSPFLAVFNSGVCTDGDDSGIRTEFSFGGSPLSPLPTPLNGKHRSGPQPQRSGPLTGEAFAAQKAKGSFCSFSGVEPSLFCFPFHSGLEYNPAGCVTPVRL